MRTRVKICGFTRVEDAVAAAYLGVDAIGLVFYAKSPRFVEVQQARKIALALPPFVSIVGLFVNETESRIDEVLNEVPMDCLQFHGDEQPEFCRKFAKPYLKAVRVKADTDFAELEAAFVDAAGLLLDAFHPNVEGGTGSSFDWRLFPQRSELPLILAGGLTPENVKTALSTIKPYALDVSSGVESEKGIKDVVKMTTFMKEVYEADRS